MQLRPIAWAGAAVLALSLSPAQAQLTATGLDCTTAFSQFSLTPLACSGSWEGNTVPQMDSLLDQLSVDFASALAPGQEFTILGKSDDAGNGPFTSNLEATSGMLSFDAVQTGIFAVAFKAGNAFSVYLFDGGTTGIDSLSFSTLGVQVNRKGMPADLSHATLVGVIPEPETYALMIAGLAALGWVARRRRQS